MADIKVNTLGYSVGSITENGIKVEIFVDDHGTWKAAHEGRELRGDTREKLRETIKKSTKRTTRKVDVPFTFVSKQGTGGIKFWRGTATGVHSGNGNVLYTRIMRGTEIREQFTGRTTSDVTLGAVTDDVLKLYHQLVKEKAAADDALRTFEKAHTISIKDAVTKALDDSE